MRHGVSSRWLCSVVIVIFTFAIPIAINGSEADYSRTYSVLSAGQSGGPKISYTQRQWLARIRRTPEYRAVWKDLRYAFVPSWESIKGIPLIVFDGHDDKLGGQRIVSAGCDIRFSSWDHRVVAVPADVACDEKYYAPFDVTPVK